MQGRTHGQAVKAMPSGGSSLSEA